jgi:signal transduction histidine kinase
MRPARQFRQLLLSLLAILLPCVVLIGLSVRVFRQERELAERRRLEEERRRVNEVRQELLARLERIKLEEVNALVARRAGAAQHAYENPAVALVAWVRNTRLRLPWEDSAGGAAFRRLLAEGEFGAALASGERAELGGGALAEALAQYRQALEHARHPGQAHYARLLLARALVKSGQAAAAAPHYRTVLNERQEIADEHGVPLALYAGQRLLEAGLDHAGVLARVEADLTANRWRTPAHAYALQELADTLAAKAPDEALRAGAAAAQQKLREATRHTEQALALQHDFPNLFAGALRSSKPVWLAFGEDPWLVSLAPVLGSAEPALLALRAKEVFAALRAGDAEQPLAQAEFLIGGEAGEGLGESFPGLRVAFRAGAADLQAGRWNPQLSFYVGALGLVLGVTLLGAYLLWRDVRREVRLAEIRSQFVSSVSHELKTPLTAIRMFAETLRIGRVPDAQTQEAYLETIVSESERLTRLLNNVLDFSKIEQGQKIYHPEPARLAEVVEAAARAMQYPLEQEGFRLEVGIEEGLPPVRIDRDAIEQAILNLLTNAVKFSGESREIGLHLRAQNGDAIIQVTDRGIGIPPEEKDRIFEKFYRARSPESRRVPGTGLGLTLVEHIARAHGGRVEVQSAPGEGSTFSLHLPLQGPLETQR